MNIVKLIRDAALPSKSTTEAQQLFSKSDGGGQIGPAIIRGLENKCRQNLRVLKWNKS
jgi:hypothetical protein